MLFYLVSGFIALSSCAQEKVDGEEAFYFKALDLPDFAYEQQNDNILNFNSFNKSTIDKIVCNNVFNASDIPDKPFTKAPCVVIANNGNILAVSHKSKFLSDKGDMDIMLAVSFDSGMTYRKTVLFSNDLVNGRKMTPNFVVDRVGANGVVGRIYCFALSISSVDKYAYDIRSRNEANCLYRYSDDNGVTWSPPYELRDKIPSEYLLFGPSPSNGIQLKNGTIVIPALVYRKAFKTSYRTGIIYKRPGQEWSFSCIDIPYSYGDNEASIIPFGDGNQIMVNVRNQVFHVRRVYVSSELSLNQNNEITWERHVSDLTFRVGTICQGSITQILYNKKTYYLFTTPRNNERNYICLWISKDLLSWKPIYYLTTTPSAGYSNIAYYNNKLFAIYESDFYAKECEIQNLTPLLDEFSNYLKY